MTPAHMGVDIAVGAEVMIAAGIFAGHYGLVYEYDGIIAKMQVTTKKGIKVETRFHKSHLMILSMNDIDRQLTLGDWQEMQVVEHYRKYKK